MNLTIPNELFNAIEVPAVSTAAVRISDFLKAIAYHVPNCSDLMVEREFWNTVCDFAERCGALVESKTAASGKTITVGAYGDSGTSAPTYGEFQRFVGAKLGDAKISVDEVTTAETSSGYTLTISNSGSGTASASYSVVPDVNAAHDTTKSGSTYPNDKWVVPAWFAKKYQKLLVAGANFRLFSISGRPWTDFNAARANALIYNREINRVSHGLITAGMRKQALTGAETAFIGNAQPAQQTTTTTTRE